MIKRQSEALGVCFFLFRSVYYVTKYSADNFWKDDEVRDTMKNSVHSKASGFLLVQVTTGDMHKHHVASRDARQE